MRVEKQNITRRGDFCGTDGRIEDAGINTVPSVPWAEYVLMGIAPERQMLVSYAMVRNAILYADEPLCMGDAVTYCSSRWQG